MQRGKNHVKIYSCKNLQLLLSLAVFHFSLFYVFINSAALTVAYIIT